MGESEAVAELGLVVLVVAVVAASVVAAAVAVALALGGWCGWKGELAKTLVADDRSNRQTGQGAPHHFRRQLMWKVWQQMVV